MSKFQVGEIAIFLYVRPRDPEWVSYTPWHDAVGKEVLILQIYDFFSDSPYKISWRGRTAWCSEHQLRKRRPPGADIVREFMHELPREVMA